MTKLEEWYCEASPRVEGMGIVLSVPASRPMHYIDGEYGRYIFRFIDRESKTPDIEIIDSVSGDAIRHGLDNLTAADAIFDRAIDFIVQLGR
jgi:hypothetical protein